MKAQVGAFNKEKALVGAFSMIVNLLTSTGGVTLGCVGPPSVVPTASTGPSTNILTLYSDEWRMQPHSFVEQQQDEQMRTGSS